MSVKASWREFERIRTGNCLCFTLAFNVSCRSRQFNWRAIVEWLDIKPDPPIWHQHTQVWGNVAVRSIIIVAPWCGLRWTRQSDLRSYRQDEMFHGRIRQAMPWKSARRNFRSSKPHGDLLNRMLILSYSHLFQCWTVAQCCFSNKSSRIIFSLSYSWLLLHD